MPPSGTARYKAPVARLTVVAVLAALVLLPGGATGGSLPIAKSLGPPPVRCDPAHNDPEIARHPRSGTCLYDLWGKDFIVTLRPNLVHVGERIGITVRPHFDETWSWSVPGDWIPLLPCKPKPGVLMPSHSVGSCTWRVTKPTTSTMAWWQDAGAQTNTCGECRELDYYAVLPASEHQLSGYVRAAGGTGVKGARVVFTKKGTGATSYTLSGAGGYYSALLLQGTYDVRTAGARLARVWLQGNRAVNLTRR